MDLLSPYINFEILVVLRISVKLSHDSAVVCKQFPILTLNLFHHIKLKIFKPRSGIRLLCTYLSLHLFSASAFTNLLLSKELGKEVEDFDFFLDGMVNFEK